MNESHPEQKPAVPTSGLLKEAQQYVLKLHNQHPDARRVFHNYSWNVSLVKTAKLLVETSQLDSLTVENILLAAWLLPTGYLIDYQNPTEESQKLAQRFLASQALAPERQDVILETIQNGFGEGPVDTPEATYVSDAFQIKPLRSKMLNKLR